MSCRQHIQGSYICIHSSCLCLLVGAFNPFTFKVTHTPKPEARGGGREEIPHASPRPRAAAGRSNRMTEARGGGREDQPHVQGAVAVRAQEGLEELSHIEGQEGQR